MSGGLVPSTNLYSNIFNCLPAQVWNLMKIDEIIKIFYKL